jgi:8-oxo-dGTP diphosphatase
MPNKKMRKKRQILATIAIIFDTQNRILLTKRNDPRNPHAHGKWQFPGGGVEFGEHPIETVHREVKEEVGLAISLITKHPLIYSHVFETVQRHIILFGFPARFVSGTIDITKDEETADAAWFTYEQTKTLDCLPLTKEIIDEAKIYVC